MRLALHTGQLVKCLLVILSPVIVLLIPTTEDFTAELRLFFAITVAFLFIIVFDLMEILVPSILLTAAYVFSGLAPIEVALSPWCSTLIYMIIGAYALVNAMEECGLLQRLSIWCIRKCGGTFNGAMYGTFLAGLVLGIITFNNAYLIMVSFAYGVTKSFGYDKPCKEAAIMMFMGAVAAHSCATSFYNPLWVGLAEQSLNIIEAGTTIPWYEQTLVLWPSLLFNLLFIFLVTKIYKTRNMGNHGDSKAYFDMEARLMGPIKSSEKKCCVVLALLMVFLITSPLHGLPTAYRFMVLPWLLYLPGVKVGSKASLSKINLGIMVFIVSSMSIASVGTYVGLTSFITDVFVPMLSHLSPVAILGGTYIGGVLGNILMTSGAMLPTFSAPFASIATGIGINPMSLIMTLILTCTVYIFPYEIPAFVILLGFGLIKMNDFIKFATLRAVVFTVGFFVLQIPYMYLIGYIM